MQPCPLVCAGVPDKSQQACSAAAALKFELDPRDTEITVLRSQIR